jgi:hypothetical protein
MLTTNYLWHLNPLAKTAAEKRDDFDLDHIGMAIKKELESLDGESLVQSAPNKAQQEVLSNKLEIVKYIISVKLAEEKAAVDRKSKAEQRRKVREAIMQKKDQQLSAASIEELERQLEELSD